LRRGGPGTDDPERLRFGAVALKPLIMTAFGVRNIQISGPSWLGFDDNFEIVAKVPPGATKNDVNVMLQNLLIERFGLVFHREMKDLPAYELLIARNGPKLKRSVENPDAKERTVDEIRKLGTDQNGLPKLPEGRPLHMFMFGPNGHKEIAATQQTTRDICTEVEVDLGRPCVDHTGLTGKYDYALAFSLPGGPPGIRLPFPPAPADAPSDPAPTLLTALQQELGLKLEEKKLPIELLVIDHLERNPTEN